MAGFSEYDAKIYEDLRNIFHDNIARLMSLGQ